MSWDLLTPYATTFTLLLLRCGGTFLFVSVFSGKAIPALMRLGIAAVVAAVLVPLAGPITVSGGILGVAMASFGEFGFGMSMGMILRLLMLAAEFAGETLGMQMGFAFSRVVDPTSGEGSSVTARLMNTVALLLLLVLDGHRTMIEALGASVHQAPVSTVLPRLGQASTVLPLLSISAHTAMRMAAPVVVALLLSNVSLGLLARTAPQLQLFILGFGLSIGIGMIVLSVAAWPTFSLLVEELQQLPAYLAAFMRG